MYPGVRHTADKHGADGEDLLSIGVGTDIAEAYTGQAAEGEVKGSDVGAAHRRAAHCAVDVGRLLTFAQLMQPPLIEKQERDSCYLYESSCSSELDSKSVYLGDLCVYMCLCMCVCIFYQEEIFSSVRRLPCRCGTGQN